MEYKLTKSAFLSGLQCPKKLWREENVVRDQPKFSTAELHRFNVGRQIGEFAQQQYAHGKLVDRKESSEAIAQTQSFLDLGVDVIFEGAFIFDDVYVRTDILENNHDGTWTLKEVKSSTEVKNEYRYDAGIQYYAASGAGLKIKSVIIQHINNQCVFPDLDDLLTSVDETKSITALQTEIGVLITSLKEILTNNEPDRGIGEHCIKPHECQYKNECWNHVPKHSIFEIPRLNWAKKNELIEKGILAINKLPQGFKLSEAQKEYIIKVKDDIPIIAKPSITQKLSALRYPLYFLDFETDNAALPRFDGARPYQQYPFQYSCHVLEENGDLRQTEYLHTDVTDPRRQIAERLIKELGEEGNIIAYNANFEIAIIKGLADQFTDLKENLLQLLPRFWDQLEIFRNDYFHPDFGGSNSIKAVLPVIVPTLNYDALDQVHDGTEAGAVWNSAIQDSDDVRRETSFENLRRYCRLDTEAMVEIHKHLVHL